MFLKIEYFKKLKLKQFKKKCKRDSKLITIQDHQQIYLIANLMSSAFTVFLPA